MTEMFKGYFAQRLLDIWNAKERVGCFNLSLTHRIPFVFTNCLTFYTFTPLHLYIYKDQFQGVVDQRTDKYNFRETEMTWKSFLPHKITGIEKITNSPKNRSIFSVSLTPRGWM